MVIEERNIESARCRDTDKEFIEIMKTEEQHEKLHDKDEAGVFYDVSVRHEAASYQKGGGGDIKIR